MRRAPSIAIVCAGLSTFIFAASAPAQQKSSSTKTTTQKVKNDIVVDNVSVEGTLDDEKVRRAIERTLETLRKCYRRELKAQPLPRGGSMDFRLLVNAKGKVVAATVEDASLRDEKIARCARSHAMGLRFKAPPVTRNTTIRYELRFVAYGPGGGACDRLTQCCSSSEARSKTELQPICGAVDQWRQLPTDTSETVCKTALNGIRAGLEALFGKIPPECQ